MERPPCEHAGKRLGVARQKLNFTLNLYRNVERELSQPNGAASMSATLRTKYIEYEVGEAIDDGRLTIEPWS